MTTDMRRLGGSSVCMRGSVACWREVLRGLGHTSKASSQPDVQLASLRASVGFLSRSTAPRPHRAPLLHPVPRSTDPHPMSTGGCPPFFLCLLPPSSPSPSMLGPTTCQCVGSHPFLCEHRMSASSQPTHPQLPSPQPVLHAPEPAAQIPASKITEDLIFRHVDLPGFGTAAR